MGAANALRRLIVNTSIVPISKEYGKNICVLPESASDYGFTLRHLPDDAIIIKSDHFPTTKNVFFKNNYMECKRSDYVLVSESKRVIMFFELKRSKSSSSSSEITAQLKGASCIMDYCEIIADTFLSEKDIFYGYKRKYYTYTYNSSQKRPFANNEKKDNSKPENAAPLSGGFVSFDRL